MKKWLNILKETYTEWSEDNCLRLGAALSFYTLGSLIPLLLVVTSIAAFFIQFTNIGQDIKADIITYIANAIGQGPVNGQPSEFMTQLSQATDASEGQLQGSLISTLIGFGTLLFTASGVFGQLYDSLNIIFDVPEQLKPQGVAGFIRSKVTAFSMVILSGIVLLASVILVTSLTTIIEALGLAPEWLVALLTQAVLLLIITPVFAAIFQFVPDIDLGWKDALVGGFVTAVLFFIGQFALAQYFANNATFSSYGIVGSVLAFVFYIYYASQILFLGGEFTQVYARSHGRLAQPETQVADAAAANGPSAVERALAEARKRELLRKEQELSQAQRRTRTTAASSGVVGLLVGAVLGGVALVAGVARTVGRLRGRSA